MSHNLLVDFSKPLKSSLDAKNDSDKLRYNYFVRVILHDTISDDISQLNPLSYVMYEKCGNLKIKYQTWQISGRDQCSHVAYWRGALLHVIPIALNEETSIDFIYNCMEKIKKHTNENAIIVFIGLNKKLDCVSETITQSYPEIMFIKTDDSQINRVNFPLLIENATKSTLEKYIVSDDRLFIDKLKCITATIKTNIKGDEEKGQKTTRRTHSKAGNKVKKLEAFERWLNDYKIDENNSEKQQAMLALLDTLCAIKRHSAFFTSKAGTHSSRELIVLLTKNNLSFNNKTFKFSSKEINSISDSESIENLLSNKCLNVFNQSY